MAAATNIPTLFSVRDMVVCITGGATGIGYMMTQAFAHNGAKAVYIVGRRKNKLDEAAASASPHGNVIPIVGDVTSKQSLMEVAEQIKKETGYINLLICNSGMMPPLMSVNSAQVDVHTFAQKALEMEYDDWVQTFNTNTVSIAFTSFAFLTLLDEGNKRGNCEGRQSQILVTSSVAGFLRPPGNFGPYGASKTAATHFVKSLAGTLVPYGIRVNAIAPGLFPSDLAQPLINAGNSAKQDPTEEGAFERSFIPAQRTGKTEDMAGTVLYAILTNIHPQMASAAGAYLNGNITLIDGGRLTGLPATY